MAQPLRSIPTSAGPPAPGPPSGLTVTALRAAQQHVLVVVGEADLHTAGQLRAQLIEMLPTPPRPVLVHLGALEFCDLAGLDALHDAARAAHDAGTALTFRGMSPRLSWLHRTFPPGGLVPSPSTPGLVEPVPDSPAAAARSTPTTAQSPPGPDRFIELEQVVDRLAQLALHAHALVERMDCLPPAVVLADPARPERIRRLQAGADLARRALMAAARLDLDAIGGSGVAGSETGDRRRADRRVTMRPTPVGPARGGGRPGAGARGADATPRRGDRSAPAGPAQPA